MFRAGTRHTGRALQRGIQCSAPLPDGSINLQLLTEIGVNYQLQNSTNLIDWATLKSFTATNWNPVLNVSTEAWPQAFLRLSGAAN